MNAYLGNALAGQVISKLVEVLRTIWLDGDDADPPTLELALSDGSYVRLSYDVDYHHPLVWRAADKDDDYESIPARESGLGDAIEPYIDQAAEAAQSHARQHCDDDGADYAMDSEAARDRGDCP